jgi:hypothetical protein
MSKQVEIEGKKYELKASTEPGDACVLCAFADFSCYDIPGTEICLEQDVEFKKHYYFVEVVK